MITVQEAVSKALQYYESLPSRGNPKEILVEEVEFSEKEKCYFVTLGYSILETLTGGKGALTAMLGPSYRREYKIFKVDAETGKVPYMKIRKL